MSMPMAILRGICLISCLCPLFASADEGTVDPSAGGEGAGNLRYTAGNPAEEARLRDRLTLEEIRAKYMEQRAKVLEAQLRIRELDERLRPKPQVELQPAPLPVPENTFHRERLVLKAITGGGGRYRALMIYDGSSFIVAPGDRLPVFPEWKIRSVGADWVGLVNTVTKEEFKARMY